MSSQMAVGWDIHRKFSQLSVVQRSEHGEIRVMKRIRLEHADRPGMRTALSQLPPGTPVAMEGAFGWPWIADLLDELGLDPHLGHPPAIKVLAKNEAKADRVDADRLGRFWLRGIFPKSYLSTPEVRNLRERLRYRMALVCLRSGMKNRVQAILHRQGILHDDGGGPFVEGFVFSVERPTFGLMRADRFIRWVTDASIVRQDEGHHAIPLEKNAARVVDSSRRSRIPELASACPGLGRTLFFSDPL
jgi:hypothetical protein